MEAFRPTTAKAQKEIERQKESVSIDEKLTDNALNDVTSLHGRVAIAGTHKMEL